MDLASWVLFGIIIGIGANSFDLKEKSSIIGWIGVSLLGALIGGLLGSLIFPSKMALDGFNLEAFTMAATFSVGLLIAFEFAVAKREHRKMTGHRLGI